MPDYDRLTTFEKAWANCQLQSSLRQTRLQRFDHSNRMLYSPVSFEYAPVPVSRVEVTTNWTVDNLLSFVRDEFAEQAESSDADQFRIADVPRCLDHSATGDEPFDYLNYCERSLIYSGHIDKVLANVECDMARQILGLLCDNKLGNKKNRNNVNADEFCARVQPLLDKHLRLTFCFPAFPFKDQNPFRTESPPHQPDLAEVAMLVRLHSLSLALWQVHPQGADWVLFCDGLVYADIFGVPKQAAIQYRERLTWWRNHLNLNGSISIVDLSDLVTRINGKPIGESPSGVFDLVSSDIRNNLQSLRSNGHPDVLRALTTLQIGMVRNLNLSHYLSSIPREELWYISRSIERPNETDKIKSVRAEINKRGWVAAIEYAAFNLSLRYFNAWSDYLPCTLRATIKPKAGQIAVPSVGRAFPWNGVGVLSHLGNEMLIEALSLSDLKGNHHRFSLPGQEGYFYYMSER